MAKTAAQKKKEAEAAKQAARLKAEIQLEKAKAEIKELEAKLNLTVEEENEMGNGMFKHNTRLSLNTLQCVRKPALHLRRRKYMIN